MLLAIHRKSPLALDWYICFLNVKVKSFAIRLQTNSIKTGSCCISLYVSIYTTLLVLFRPMVPLTQDVSPAAGNRPTAIFPLLTSLSLSIDVSNFKIYFFSFLHCLSSDMHLFHIKLCINLHGVDEF